MWATIAVAAVSLAQTASAEPSTIVIAPTAPPPPRVEMVPQPPAPVDVWTPGHWAWNGATWEWVPGQYIARPAPQASWVPGHWEPQAGGYVWVDGHWSS